MPPPELLIRGVLGIPRTRESLATILGYPQSIMILLLEPYCYDPPAETSHILDTDKSSQGVSSPPASGHGLQTAEGEESSAVLAQCEP